MKQDCEGAAGADPSTFELSLSYQPVVARVQLRVLGRLHKFGTKLEKNLTVAKLSTPSLKIVYLFSLKI